MEGEYKNEFEIRWDSVNWIHLAQDRGQWWEHVKELMCVLALTT